VHCNPHGFAASYLACARHRRLLAQVVAVNAAGLFVVFWRDGALQAHAPGSRRIKQSTCPGGAFGRCVRVGACACSLPPTGTFGWGVNKKVPQCPPLPSSGVGCVAHRCTPFVCVQHTHVHMRLAPSTLLMCHSTRGTFKQPQAHHARGPKSRGRSSEGAAAVCTQAQLARTPGSGAWLRVLWHMRVACKSGT